MLTEPRGARLGSIAGTSIYVQVSFLILAAFFVVIALENGEPMREALLWIPTLFISVVFHELAHAATIGLLGHGSSQILLGGFGGLTVNARVTKPWREIVIAFAGPLAGILLSFALGIAFVTVPILSRDPMLAAFLPKMIDANFYWGVFNLFPIYPLDGGLMFKNFTRYFTNRERTVRVSALTSLALAVALTIVAVMYRQFFFAAITGMLALQNYQRLQIGDAEP